MPFNIGGIELALILVIVVMLFGVGKLPEVFGSVGKGLKEFRKEMETDSKSPTTTQIEQPAEPVEQPTTLDSETK